MNHRVRMIRQMRPYWPLPVPVRALRRILPHCDPSGNVNAGRRKGWQDRDVLDVVAECDRDDLPSFFVFFDRLDAMFTGAGETAPMSSSRSPFHGRGR